MAKIYIDLPKHSPTLTHYILKDILDVITIAWILPNNIIHRVEDQKKNDPILIAQNKLAYIELKKKKKSYVINIFPTTLGSYAKPYSMFSHRHIKEISNKLYNHLKGCGNYKDVSLVS